MGPLSLLLAPAELFERTDWHAVGLVASVLGSFLLANAILFRHPRTMVEELFTGEKRELRPIREYIFHRVQVTLGFFYLLSGFCLQLLGHYPASGAEALPVSREFPVAWVGAIVLSAVVLHLFGWMLSHALFRHYVRRYLMRHPFAFETEVKLAREVGELLGLRHERDETVQSYLARLRQRLGILETDPKGGKATGPRGEALSQLEAVAVGDEEL